MSDEIKLELAALWSRVEENTAQIAALVRAGHAQRQQQAVAKCDSRTVRARLNYARMCEVAVAYSGKVITMNTAAAIRAMLDGDLDPPAGCAHTVDLIREQYERTPCVDTIWRALKELRNRIELKRLT